MAVTWATPEQDIEYKKKLNETPMPLLTTMLPGSSVRDLSKTTDRNFQDIGLGDFGINVNPLVFDRSMDKTYQAFSDRGLGVLDPQNPLGYGSMGPGGGNMTGGGIDVNSLLSRLLQGGNLPPGTGITDTNMPHGPGTGYNSPLSMPNLLNPATFSGTYKAPPTAGTDSAFQSYIDSISGKSPAESAMRSTEQQILDQTLKDIEQQTAGTVASTKMDMLDRGLGGAGQASDIEANALAQARTGGLKEADKARLALAQTEEQRAADREKAMQAAYGEQYKTKATQGLYDTDIAARGATTDVNAYNDLMKTLFQGGITTGEGAATRASNTKDSLVSNLLNYGLGQQKLSTSDQEFYAKLAADAEQNALGRTADYNNRLIGSGSGGDDFWTGLGESLLTGVAGQIGGGIGSTVTGGLTGALTPKKKTTPQYSGYGEYSYGQ